MRRAPLLAAAALALAAAVRADVPLDADGFRLAVPPWRFAFPRDHAAHPSFRTEWWYYTGHLAARGRAFGYEVTFFRIGLPAREPSASRWRARDVVFLHLALTDETRGTFRHAERASRAALALAGADSTRYAVWLAHDSAGLAPDGATHRLRAREDGFGVTLDLVPLVPPVAHGRDGVSRKSAALGAASHYYSIPWLATRGTVFAGADSFAVTGTTWMDHEFGSASLAGTHTGWDWFSVQLGDGRALMLYRLRLAGGGIEPFSSGTLIERDGRSRPLALADFDVRATGVWTSPHSGGRYPSGWRVRVPSAGLDLALEPTVRDQELTVSQMGGIAYWEGSVRVLGTSRGSAVRGQGYVELTGYAGPPPF